MSTTILHHPTFGNPPVVNTVRVYNDSRKRKVIRLTKVRRRDLLRRRERRQLEEQEQKTLRAAQAKAAERVKQALSRTAAERTTADNRILRAQDKCRIYEALPKLSDSTLKGVATMIGYLLAHEENPPAG